MRPTLTPDLERKEYLSDMPKRWRNAGKKSWQEPSLGMVHEALGALDPASAPGHDGFTGAFYKAFSSYFAPVLLDVIREVGSTGHLPKEWCEGMTRCVPKEQGCISVDKQRPITLLTCKINWLTGVLKVALQDTVSYVVPHEQAGFMKGGQMESHLFSVQRT